ncbi:MAG: hypothetical protein P0Y53_17420 [Candidatus Pseudobacter hemicellulosilyticus]|uniref:Uncharacterized protein n=1 Tax=Candidatus Pseudobacter hemicellulosilyticus TaxID=3121375 RepID=A0AAJ5WNA0_9BACT|nr:MAG: hypothetical protein P0Y53_17420 [Pseudobacter sp.]
MEALLAYKQLLKAYCEEVILQRIASSRSAMDSAQEAANQEEKSSAGDKYETSRAMSHLEKDMHARQLVAHQQELNALRAINSQAICTVPGPGAVIRCSSVTFFIAAGLGKQMVNQETIIFLSPQSPIARQLMQQKVGDEIEFKGRTTIRQIF